MDSTKASADPSDDCYVKGADYILTVSREVPKDQDGVALPLELTYFTAPLSTEPLDQEGKEKVEQLLPRPDSKGNQVTGGSSYGTAKELKDSTVTGSMRIGEAQYFKVPVHEGQQVRVRADFAPAAGKSMKGMADTDLVIKDPALRTISGFQSSNYDTLDEDSMATIGGVSRLLDANFERPLGMVSAVPVNPANVYSSRFDSLSLPGYYYVVVGAEEYGPDKTQGLDVRYTLTWDTVGEAKNQELVGVNAQQRSGGGDSAQAQQSNDTEEQGKDQAAAAQDASGAKQSGLFGLSLLEIVLFGVIGVLVLAGILVGVLLMSRNRSRNP